MSLEQDIRELGPWFHTFIIDGIHTKPEIENQWSANYPDNLWGMIKELIPFDLKGKKVLDIGCDAGYMSFEMAKMGAIVTAVDIQQGVSVGKQKFHRPLDQARYLENNVFKLGVNFVEKNFLDINDMNYDFVLFCGVYYHMPDHKLAFPKIRNLLKHGGVVITESAVGHIARYYTGQGNDIYHDDPTNYFIPSQDYILKDLLTNQLLNCNWNKYLFDSRILITSVKAIK